MPAWIYIVFAVLGLAGVVVGVYAFFAVLRGADNNRLPPAWRRTRTVALITGVVIGLSTWPLTYWMGYPIVTHEGMGRIVGFPFIVAFFDAQGRDYIGPMTLVGVILNILFWFLLPQVVLWLYARRLHATGPSKA